MTKKSKVEYYCVAVRRNYEEVWRIVSKHDTQEEAQAELEKRRSYTGAFNYDNAELRDLTRRSEKRIWQELGIQAHRQHKSHEITILS